jgi:hypothetical protein
MATATASGRSATCSFARMFFKNPFMVFSLMSDVAAGRFAGFG